MTDQAKQKFKYWLIGLFSGGAVAAPVTAFVCKKIYDKKVEEAEYNGMNAMAEYAVQQQNVNIEGEVITERDENGKPIAGRYPWGKDSNPTAEEDYADPTEYDVSVEEDMSPEDDEAKERTVAHQRYLDMVDKYNGNAVISPYAIDSDQYFNEAYMQKSSINWYEEDNVFEEDLRVIEDPFMTFGVTDGHELFKDADIREDPDICYLRDEGHTTDYEINRIHGSYSDKVGGERPLGEADT